jgi:hypothetical protein
MVVIFPQTIDLEAFVRVLAWPIASGYSYARVLG